MKTNKSLVIFGISGWGYRAAQMSDKDVVLENPKLQQIYQSEVIQRLLHDEAFQRSMGSLVQKEIAEKKEELLTRMNSPEFQQALASEDLRKVMKSENFQKLMQSDNFWWGYAGWLIWRGGW